MDALERQHARLSSAVLGILFPEECTAEDKKEDADAAAERADPAEITQEDLQRLYKSFSDGISDELCTEQDEASCSDESSEGQLLTTRSQRKRLRYRKLKEAMTQLQAQRAGRFVGPLPEGRLPPAELPEQPTEKDVITCSKADTSQVASTAPDNLTKSKRRKLAKRLKRASSSEKDCRGFTAEEIDGHLIIKPC